VELDLELNPKMWDWAQKLDRYNVAFGGRGSSKSWAVASIIVAMAFNEKHKILCTRKIQNNIRDSVYALIVDTIGRMGLESFFVITEKEIRGRNGSIFIFKGLDTNIREIKSMEDVSICWVEEANSIKDAAWKILRPTVRKTGSKFFIVFNPDETTDPAYQMFVENPIDGTNSVFINYQDNKWFSDELKAEMEYDRKVDYQESLVTWDGQCREISEAVIFKGKFEVKEFESDPNEMIYQGADFGFSEDPMTVNSAFIRDRCLYLEYEVNGVHIEINGHKAKYEEIPYIRKYQIRGDNARPELISHLRKEDKFNIVPCKKGKNSIVEGIEFIRSFERVYIHPRCVNTIYEFGHYKYKVDPITGVISKVIVDKDNHHVDGIRYALEKVRKSKYKNSNWSANDLGL